MYTRIKLVYIICTITLGLHAYALSWVYHKTVYVEALAARTDLLIKRVCKFKPH